MWLLFLQCNHLIYSIHILGFRCTITILYNCSSPEMGCMLVPECIPWFFKTWVPTWPDCCITFLAWSQPSWWVSCHHSSCYSANLHCHSRWMVLPSKCQLGSLLVGWYNAGIVNGEPIYLSFSQSNAHRHNQTAPKKVTMFTHPLSSSPQFQSSPMYL